MLLASHETPPPDFWWAYPVTAVLLVGLVTWLLLPDPEGGVGPNRSARGALALLLVAWVAWLLWPDDALPGTVRARLGELVYLVGVSGFLAGAAFAGIGAGNVRRQGERLLAAAAVAAASAAPVFLVTHFVICMLARNCFTQLGGDGRVAFSGLVAVAAARLVGIMVSIVIISRYLPTFKLLTLIE